MTELMLALIVLVVIAIWKGLRIVPQGEEWVVERLGRFNRVLMPGLNLIIPFIYEVRYKVTTKDIILDVPQQEVITRDNAVILANAVSFIKVSNIERSVYGIEDFREAMRNMVQTSLRSIIGGMDLNQALTSRDRIKAELKEAIADEALDWGLTVKSVEIQDIKPSPNMQQAMEMQASAERERVALVTRSEGEKQAIILNAEARLEAARKDAEGQMVAAQASAEAIRLIAEAVKENNSSATFLLGDRYIQALQRMGESENSKIVALPGDIVSAIRAIVGGKS
ncbi:MULTISPECIES: SPFH domain-containing protein [Methylovorus]|jgi:regulator of protease activity HflC (stomatin/prohibitin superfamily)|uniref:Band 7 protein n=1 Tax=Methylovorus glucosotrophus (strain SIP3-4) TaxID=582744 RepID=C6X869_METGS|nr:MULTISPECIES: SPFH domain-containing protein [Methylovorus]ACT49339.1 band 7 protein [Methylovorus glucosotrophus SIP3-4]ADQ83289.1 band 7 protein [Methylovorus sp. MP688]HWU34481.1 SPFH domain-containing protein [Methylovorus sp.]